jgi:probable HAF family extracellular repeat protein
MKTLTLTFTLLAATLAVALDKYQTFGLGPDTGFNRDGWSYVTDINDSGQVLGWWPTNGEAFVISPGDLWTRNIVKTNGQGPLVNQGPINMNNAAAIIGQEGPSNRAFYKPWGQPPVLIGYSGDTLNAINNAGWMTGTSSENVPKGQSQLYLTSAEGGLRYVNFPHDQYPHNVNDVRVAGLNNLNQIVGSWLDYSTPRSGFFYDSTSNELNTSFNMPGAVTTYPTAINDNQEVVGNWFDANGVQHGFYWNPTAGFSDIDVAGDTAMGLVAINNGSVILGWWQDDNSPMLVHYVTIVNGQSTASINVPKSRAGSTVATAINNVGQVVGEYETQEGVVRGFIYTPPK